MAGRRLGVGRAGQAATLAAAPPAWAEAEAAYAKAVELLPNEAGLRYDRGRMYATEGKWDKLAADFDAALKLKAPDGEAGWVDIMMMLAAAGDRDVFRRAADRMFALYGGSENLDELQQTAECCLMLPDACGDPKGCLRAAEKAYAADQGVWRAQRWPSHDIATGSLSRWSRS